MLVNYKKIVFVLLGKIYLNNTNYINKELCVILIKRTLEKNNLDHKLNKN